MSAIDSTDALARCPPFDRLPRGELALLAEAARRVRFAAGRCIHVAGAPPPFLVVVVAGGVTGAAGDEEPVTFDLADVLLARDVRRSIHAGPEGVEALLIARPHLFTLARERPELLASNGEG